MLKLTRLTSSSLALILALFAGSAHGQIVEPDPTFDVQTDNAAVMEELEETEEELRDFFEDQDETAIRPDRYTPAPDLTAREESALLKRANREATEFNDIDDDDLAELDRKRTMGVAPRLEKPGQVEKDVPITCPLGTVALAGDCVTPD